VYGAYKAEEEFLTSQKNLSAHELTGFYATWPTGDFEISPANLFFDQVIGTWILITGMVLLFIFMKSTRKTVAKIFSEQFYS
jgi:hypothetical protein